MSKPKVATVTLSWNQKDDLRDLLNCVKRQTFKPDIVVIVDNGSADGSAEMVKKEFKFAKVFRLNENTGYAKGYNLCFSRIPDYVDYVVVLDQDITIGNDFIQKFVEKFEDEPDTTAIIAGDVCEPRIKTLNLQEGYIKMGFHGSNFAYRNKYKKYMEYPEEFFAHTCEADLAARLIGRGLRVLFTPEIVTYHKRDSAKRNKERIFLETRNVLWYVWRNCDIKNSVIMSLAYIPILYSKASKSQQLPAFFTGVAAAFSGLPYCARTRRVCGDIGYTDIADLKKIGRAIKIITPVKKRFKVPS